MQAIQVSQTGGPEVLTPTTVSEPREHPDRVLVQVEAMGVNYIDTYQRAGVYPLQLPFVPGLEGAGTVVHVGEAIEDIEEGDRVAWAMTPGSYAQMVSVPRHDLYVLPDYLDTRTGAALMLQGLTAHFLATSVYPIAAGDIVVIHAAAGGVGQLLTQLARARGARVIATVGSESKAEVARRAGANDVIRYDKFDSIGEELPRAVRGLTVGAGAHAVYDGVGAATFDGSLASLRPRGTLALFGQASGPVPAVDPQRLNAAGSVYLTRPSLGHFIATATEREQRATELWEAVKRGQLTVSVHGTYPLSDAAKAHTDLESRATTGKLLLVP